MVIAAAISPHLPKISGQEITLLHCTIGAAFLLLFTRCVSSVEVRKSIRWDILITIACAMGISKGLENSGAADWIVSWLLPIAGVFGKIGVLVTLYLITTLLTAIITNTAAVAIAFPIAIAAASQLGVDSRPFMITISIAATASFITPISYQTNLIVQGAGGYRFKDYVRVGVPLTILFLILSTFLIPAFWSF